ncbi:VOC family protein [Pedobacter montanisoli]|uniref:VOC domain-containing protein n=1 Tax=Pedobacter montanisoli TaxID=2923277 RepID=A0ABS9ZXH5_9SPHI|nr:VOC family protein [Pedobacter montanisoli]MCJ0742992.1 hypothetical protein [Pedobacter montanisoli]
MKFKLDSVILYVQNVERLKTFYTEILKLQILEEDLPIWVLLSAGAFKIGLHKMGETYADQIKEGYKFDNNTKLVFEIEDDIHKVRTHLLEQGVAMRAIKTYDDYAYLLCDGEDPEGNVFQLKQQKYVL